MLGIGAKHDLPTILIIDDDMVSREVMATVLTMTGYTVHTATDGTDAVNILGKESCTPELILMDTQMPGLSGPPLVKELRAHSPASIFAISAGEPPSELVEVVDGFLMKPFNPDSLQALLEKSSPVPAVEEDVERPVVKPEILAQLRGMMNEAAVREIYSAIVSDLDRRIIALRTALGKEDVEEIRRIGHSIKGGCGMAGALQAAHLGARLEVESNHLDNGKVILDQLHSAARNLESMLKAEFPS